MSPARNCMINRFHRCSDIAYSRVVQYTQAHQTGTPHHPRDADRVITLCSDNACNCGPVTVFVFNHTGINYKIPAVCISVD